MNKTLLIKYISGQASGDEERIVLEWVSETEENEKYFVRLMNLWVSQNMPEEEASDAEVTGMLRLVNSREERGVKTKRGFFIPRGSAWLGAAVLLLVAGIFIWTAGRKAPIDSRMAYVPMKYDTSKMLYTDKGVKGRVVLPDSSVVWLNSDSRLLYPDEFPQDRREVYISGEGYFEVKHEPERPMTVNTNKGFRVEVLGTSFNLKSYDNDEWGEATLYSGSINLVVDSTGDGAPSITRMQPNEKITIMGNRRSVLSLPENPADDSAWKEGRILFEGTSIREAIKILERWHGVEFVVTDRSILDDRITANFEAESINQIMDLIKMTSYIDYTITDGRVVRLTRR